MPVSVCIPIFNEEANLPALLDALLAEQGIGKIIAVDDRSTDSSFTILSAYAGRNSRVLALRNPQRSGQLAAWVAAARAAETATLVFIDADALPAPGAVELLSRAISANVVIASGRVVPAGKSARRPAARFRANVIHRVRCLAYAKEAIIGRFFAVDRDWFLGATTRTDIIANDAYLSCLAQRQHQAGRYVRDAVCYYSEAATQKDFAAQRQRADAGYAQLRSMKILLPEDEPSASQYVQCLVREALADPIGGAAWIRNQLSARFMRAYQARGRDAGAWETQASTKQRVDV